MNGELRMVREATSPAGILTGAVQDQLSPNLNVPSLVALHGARRRRALRPRRFGHMIKRVMDLAISSGALLVLSPLMLLIAAVIVIESSGPALFVQRRGGQYGRTFLIFKFRTMTALDDDNVVGQARRNDARITRFGSFLRKSSLDELPQLLNVFRGEMSIVGPRPHAIAHDRSFAAMVPAYSLRTRAKPGITGLAQVSGFRGLIESPEDLMDRLSADFDYIKRWSLLMDLQIMFATARLIFRDKRAH